VTFSSGGYKREPNDCDSGKSPMGNSLTAPLFGAVAAHAPPLPVVEKGQPVKGYPFPLCKAVALPSAN